MNYLKIYIFLTETLNFCEKVVTLDYKHAFINNNFKIL